MTTTTQTRTVRCAECGLPVETDAVFPADATLLHGACWRKRNPAPPPNPYATSVQRDNDDEDLL